MIKSPLSNKDIFSQPWQEFFRAIEKAINKSETGIVETDQYYYEWRLDGRLLQMAGYTKTPMTLTDSLGFPFKSASNYVLSYGINLASISAEYDNVHLTMAANTHFSASYIVSTDRPRR